MTYPQGPYGQQPDPYGQQQPQYGGYQQQPQYGGAYDQNAQYGGAYGQQYGGFGGGPQPPKNKGPVVAVVAIVVLILAGLGITGFVAPGFFLSDDKGSNTASGGDPSSSSPSEKKDADSADAFIDKLVAAADAKSESKLEGYQCYDASDDVKDATKHIDETDSVELTDTREESETKVVATLTIKVDGDEGDYEATVTRLDDEWCWADFSGGGGTPTDETSTTDEPTDEPTGAPTGGGEGADGVAFIQSFLDKLNAGDGAGAAAMSCADSTSQGDITQAAAQSPDLKIDVSGTTADPTYVGAPLVGTVGGKTVTARTSAFVENDAWCIYTFFAY